MYILKNKLIAAAQTLLHRAGIQIVKTSRMATEAQLMGALLAEATAAEAVHRAAQKPKLTKAVTTGVIFSFNRPVQLELLLRSYFALATNPQPLIVQYGAKGENFAKAYAEVEALYPHVMFVTESKFRETLQTTLAQVTTPNIFFLVDDIVFTRPTDMAAFGALDTAQYIPSLRLAPTLNYSYTANAKAPAPSFTPGPADMLAFKWNETPYEWSYPMSVDGHLFNTAEIAILSRVLPYKAPNTYEGALMRLAPVFSHRTGLCFATPRILNNPCNKVQTEVANRAGGVTPEALLELWQSGQRISLAPFLNYNNTSPHTEVELTFEPREATKKNIT